MEQEPSQVAVEGFGIPAGSEVTVLESPVGNSAADAVNDLPHAFFPLVCSRFAEEIFAGDDVYGKLTPRTGEFAITLLENGGPTVSFDAGGSSRPFDGIEGITNIFRAERRFEPESFGWSGIKIVSF